MDKLYLGIDAGATKTALIMADGKGKILVDKRDEGINLHNLNSKISIEKLSLLINHTLGAQMVAEAVVVGLAGLDTDRDEIVSNQLREKIKTKSLTIVNDGLIGFRSGTDSKWGVCLIASTGANCYGITKTGKEVKAGGWGYLIGDQGSGYAIGKKILEKLMKEYDGREMESGIGDKVLHYLNLTNIPELMDWVYHQTEVVERIASLSRIIPEVDSDYIWEETTDELFSAYKAVFRKLDLGLDDTLPVVLIGGLFNLPERWTDLVVQKILAYTPGAKIIKPQKPPVYGALKIALETNRT
jgi:N-acetylglucosamine kinase-like BadF-type ATPase